MSKQQPSLKQLKKLDSIEIQSPTKQSKYDDNKKMHKSEHKHSPSFVHDTRSSQHEKKQQEPAPHALYEETFYLTGLRQNYLVLLSDNMHIIQLPVGLLKANVSIGDPIKLKLQFDTKKAQTDRRKFISVQENLLKQFTPDQ